MRSGSWWDMVTAGHNDWQSQPRDPNTGRFLRRAEEPRSETIKLRLTPQERRQIEEMAAVMGMTITSWMVYRATT